MTIRESIWVAKPVAASFKLFCEDMSEWWIGGFRGKDSRPRLELRIGGRFYERTPDGGEYEIGRVTAYQPRLLVALTWRSPSWEEITQVEIRFSPENGGTRVDLEHSGWEQSARTRDAQKNYDTGWGMVLGHYEKAIKAAA